ncbi:MAG TPA: hypothetical protein DC000_02885 [Clostridiales bacterium]|nr:hypothetical protein [Clostridiales bacterium]
MKKLLSIVAVISVLLVFATTAYADGMFLQESNGDEVTMYNGLTCPKCDMGTLYTSRTGFVENISVTTNLTCPHNNSNHERVSYLNKMVDEISCNRCDYFYNKYYNVTDTFCITVKR